MAEQFQDKPALLRRKEVESRTGLSCSSIYLRISEGNFPKPISIDGAHTVRWVESEVCDWIMRQIKQSRSSV